MSPEKKILKKNYARDISVILEQLWAQKMIDAAQKYFGMNPYRPYTVFHVTGENIEIWEYERAIRWFQDRLLEKNEEGTQFIEFVMSVYRPLLESMKTYWTNGATSDYALLEEYKECLQKALELFPLWYYAGTDERTPGLVKKIVLDARATDEFFAANDQFIKGCVVALGGDRQLSNFILSDEFPDIPPSDILRSRTSGFVIVDGHGVSFL